MLSCAGVVARGDSFSDSPNLPVLFKYGRDRGVISDQREERRFVRDETSEEVGAPARKPKRDGRSEGVPGYPHRRESQVLDQPCEVSDVLTDAALPCRTLALAVTAAVVSENAKRLGQTGCNQIPVVMGSP